MARKKETNTPFHILQDGDTVLEAAQEALEKLMSRKKNRHMNLLSMQDVRQEMIPLPNMLFEWAFSTRGLYTGKMIDVIGGEHLGKTTMMYYLMGHFMSLGIPCLYIETEGKPITDSWARRCLSTDRALSDKMLKALHVMLNVYSLDAMHEGMLNWLRIMREEAQVPKTVPLVVVIDTLSKLMSNSEAAGVWNYGDYMDSKKHKPKDINTGQTMEHAKWRQDWCRRMAAIMSEYNASVFLVQHQNDKVDMGGTPSFLSADQGALYNKRKTGGRATDQSTAFQVILGRVGMLKDSTQRNVGTRIKLRVDKNSYGPNNRIVEYGLKNEGFADTESYQESPIDYRHALAALFADQKWWGTTVTSKRYSSNLLGVRGADAESFVQAVESDPQRLQELKSELGIYGYAESAGALKKKGEKTNARSKGQPKGDTAPDDADAGVIE